MRYVGLLLCCLVSLGMATPAGGATILFSDLSQAATKDAAMGISITPTGPNDLPFVQPDWEVLGATPPFLNNSDPSRISSGVVAFSQPITRLTLDVARTNNSGWQNPITLTAFDGGKKIATNTVNLMPLGDWTQITISAPAIDQVDWQGSGWVFHPYFVRDAEITFAKNVSTPQVGSSSDVTPAPEPGSFGILILTSSIALTRRRRDMPT